VDTDDIVFVIELTRTASTEDKDFGRELWLILQPLKATPIYDSKGGGGLGVCAFLINEWKLAMRMLCLEREHTLEKL